MRLIISNLVRDEQLLMEFVGIYFIFLKIYLSCNSNAYTITVFHVKFLVPTRFLMRGFCFAFLHDALHIRVRKRRQTLILHKVLDVNPHINFMNKGMSIFQKLHV